MQKIIKKIRTYMNISQKEFAEKIGVTVSTVNRWEKGAAPTENMAEGIYSLCVKNNIPAYDMIIDEIKAAADSIVLEENRILLYLNGNITDTALVNSLSALKLDKQYAAVTQKGCDEVRIEKELDISGFEKRFLRTIADKNRKSGVDFANRVCKDYRREGRFFDEILDDAL